MSGLVNKVKDALHSGHKNENNVPEGTHGPHSSRAANAADPRIDSDLDSTRHTGAGRTAGHGEYGSGHNYTATEGSAVPRSGMTGAGHGVGTTGTTNLEGTSGYGHHQGTTGYGHHEGTHTGVGGRTAGSGLTGASNLEGTSGTGAYGHHEGAHTGVGGRTAGSGVTGVTGTHGAPAGTHGPHGSRVANAADPRIDSDRDGRAAIGTGPGPASNTAGPHKNDMLNKADPRVDSDMDGSRTVGGNKTYQSTSLGKDPTDAAQVPPSVLKKHVGDVSMEHADAGHGRERRNSTKTHQENFRGI